MKKIIKVSIVAAVSALVVGCASPQYIIPPAGPLISKHNGKPYWVDQASCPKYDVSKENTDILFCADANETLNGVILYPMDQKTYTDYLERKLLESKIEAENARIKAIKDREFSEGLESFGNSMKQMGNSMNQNTQNTYNMMNQMNYNKPVNCTSSTYYGQTYTNCR